MNLVALIGNVAAAPELRTTAGGRSVCTFRLAVSRPGGEDADFVSVVAWERQAEVCSEYLHVGRRVGIEGRLHQSTWEIEEGEGESKITARRSKVEVVAHRVQLLGARKVENQSTTQADEHTPAPMPTDIPTDTFGAGSAGVPELQSVT